MNDIERALAPAIFVILIMTGLFLPYAVVRADYVKCHEEGAKEDIVSDVRWSFWDGCLWKVDGEWFVVPDERYRLPKYRVLNE